LGEVICQFRFPAVLKISATAPADFQDAIRDDYPWYEEQAGGPSFPKEIIDLLPSGIPAPVLPRQPVYQFFTEDRGRSITLGQESITISENNYQDWASFRKEIERAERVLRGIYAPSFYTRVALRYRDVLDREEYGLREVPWEKLLNPSFIGILGDGRLSDDIYESQSRALLKIPDVDSGFVLIEHGLASGEQGGQPVYLIDSDFFTNKRCKSHDALQSLDRFNKWGGHLFRWATKDKLRTALRPRTDA
jgi:uncharacterized protein (TIGR04255 family)